jgi:hypothetical protein
LDAVLELIELRLGDVTMSADAVAPQPAGVRQFQRTGQPAVIGQQQQAFGIEVEPADADKARQTFRQVVEHRGAPLGIVVGRHQAARLMIQKQPRALTLGQRLAVDGHNVVRGDVQRGRVDDAAVHRDAALHDPVLGVAAGT